MQFARTGIAALAAAMALWGPSVLAQPKEFQIDRSHSSINFEIDHWGFARVAGRFNDFSGKVVLDEADLAKAAIELTVKADSIDTNHKARDQHLRTADFFDAAKFPAIVFKSTKVELIADRKGGKLTGDLTLHGVTKPVTLDFKLTKEGNAPHPAYKNLRMAAFQVTGQIKRSEFDMKFGIPAVGDAVDLKFHIDIIHCVGEAVEAPSCKY
ncbi:MAG: YceI family protein [Hyphomicrobiaceae bacterium]